MWWNWTPAANWSSAGRTPRGRASRRAAGCASPGGPTGHSQFHSDLKRVRVLGRGTSDRNKPEARLAPPIGSLRAHGRVGHRRGLRQQRQQRRHHAGHGRRRAERAHGQPARAQEDRQGRGPAQPDRLGGLPEPDLGEAVRAADRLPDQREVRRQLGRDGRADEERRRRPVRHGVLLGRRGPAHPLRGRRAPGEHQPDPELEGLLPRVQVPAVQHHQRRALRGLAAVGPERADVQHQGLQDCAAVLERDLRRQVQGPGHRPGQPDPDRRRGAVPVQAQAGPGHHRPVRADPAAVQGGGEPARRAAPADREVLGPGLPGDLRLQERQRDHRRRLAVPGQHAQVRQVHDRVHDPERGSHRLGRHLDARGQGAPPELRVHVDAVHQHAEGPGRAGRQLRRDPGQQARLPDHEPAPGRVVRSVPRQRAEQLPRLDQPVEDPDRDLRQRPVGLHALLRVGIRLEYPGQVTAPVNRKANTLSAALWRRPWARATLLLTPPLAWFVLLYLAALVVLLITAFWQINPFTTNIERVFSFSNLDQIFTSGAYRAIIVRTVGMAAAVTVADAIVAFPFAYFMARIASPRARTALFVAILLPLWASYLAKVYSWLLIFTHNGFLDWGLGKLGIGQVHLIYTNWAVFTVFCYLWLPFMIIPVYAALERIPASQIEASQDLGGRTWRTTRSVLLPLALPGIVAGSIFTFSLTLGDYITPLLVGGTSANFMGNIIYTNIGIANNVPFAAAMALVPIVIMAVYLLSARALGAFEEI